MAGTERLKVNLVQGENRVQTVVKGQIEVPEAKPDVDKILSKDATAKVRDVSIVPDKVIIDGTLTLQVMYVAFKPDQSVHSMHGDVRFTTYVDVIGADPGMDYVVEFTVEDVSITPSKKDARKFDVAAVLDVFVKVMDVDEMEVLTSTPSGNEALNTQDITVEHMVGDKVTKQVIVSDVYEVPEEKPDVEKILETDAEAEITDKRVLAGKVIVDGEVTIQVLYASMTPEQSVHNLHHTIKFSDFLEVPEAQPGMNVCVRAVVENADTQPVVDPALSSDVIVKLIVWVTETRTLKDVPTKLKDEEGYTRKKLKVDREIGSGETQVVIRETTEVPEPKPDIEKILEARVDKTEVTETKILREKVLIRGYSDVEVIYVSMKPDQAVHAMHQRLNFRNFVVVPDAYPDMKANVKVTPEYVSVDQHGVELHTEAVLKVKATVTELSQLNVYVPEEVAPTVAPTPTPTPCVEEEYTIQPGDTLYEIAKAKGVTLAMLEAANPQITNPNDITPGQVIKIPCEAMG